jgi:type III secretory pathway lipoprotein EscJ
MPVERARPDVEEADSAAPSLLRQRSWSDLVGLKGVWLIVGVAIVACGAFFFSTWNRDENNGMDWLYAGHAFPQEEADRIITVLKSAHIPCAESAGRVGVSAARKAEALGLLAKNRLGRPSLQQLLDEESTSSSIFETPEQRESRWLRSRARFAAERIGRVRGVFQSFVLFTHIEGGTSFRPIRKLKATVFLEAEGGQALSAPTVRIIRDIVTSVIDVNAEDVSILDESNGRNYLVSGNPELSAPSSLRGREEALCGDILNQLHIEGARASVRIDSDPVIPDSLSTWVNQPIGDVDNSSVDSRNESTVSAARAERATVLVRIPRSYFLRLFRQENPGLTPTPEELSPLVVRVRESVRNVVRTIIPENELAELKIDRIDDIAAVRGTVVEASRASPLSFPSWLPIAGGVVLAISTLVVLCGGWMTFFRSAVDRKSSGNHVDGANVPPIFEQARGFAVRDQAGAAGVLHRWIVQGGHTR